MMFIAGFIVGGVIGIVGGGWLVCWAITADGPAILIRDWGCNSSSPR